MWGSSQYQYYEKAIEAFEDLQQVLANIKTTLMMVHGQLISAIDHNLSDLQDKTDRLHSNVVKRSIVKSILAVKRQSDILKDYCMPLKDAKNLEDFKKFF